MKCTICGFENSKEIVAFNTGVKILLCKNCSNAYTYLKPQLPDYTNEDFHAKGMFKVKLTQLDDLPSEIQDSYQKQLRLISRCIPGNADILEIGGGEGIFLDLVKKSGFRVELLEPSVSAAARAKQRGLKVYNDYFQNINLEKKYDLVCMAHVLEHIDDPLNALEHIKKLLRPNGFLLLTQTNYKGFMPFLLKERWYAWVPDQHFSHFTMEGINYMANATQFKVVDYKYSRLYHGPSIYHSVIKYIPFLQDQIHVLLKRI